MTRIVAGRWGGRRLEVPKGDATRPTTDRVRESLFASLTSELGSFDGLAVLDLYAGSGALGLESMSRGADRVHLVESDRRAASTIRRNLAALSAAEAQVHVTTVERFVARGPFERFDLVFLDPPYPVPADDVRRLLVALQPWRADDSLVVLERSSRDPAWTWPDGMEGVRDRTYGETTLWYGR